ncbi:hypothetical protein ACFFV7_21805 [Nonomuraea spiralis]|uniref:Uncharacterized protein n=1 Tax=Nonomuraea spiralis TaxID=46182 RepID=A0ABV5IHJ6_9ACTN|nr:hypothetical protein [Nonomuraea spiralis]GGS97296.1 hypothetical protein GCM10010176_046410 [Nonomuraea spiralis]
MNLTTLGRDGLMTGTGAAVTLSALGVPAAWPFVGKMYVHQYDPQAFFDAATTWLSAHDDVVATRLDVEALVAGVAVTDWRSEDGRAFQRRMDAYLADLRGVEIRAVVTAIVLYTAGAALAAMLLFQFLVAAAMAAVALWVLTAAVTPLSLASARLLAMQCLIKLFEGYQAVESMLDALLHGCAATLGAAVVVDVAAETVRGDRGGLNDLAAATFAQGPMLVWGTANRVERDLTAHGLSGRFPSSGPWSSARGGSPLPPGLSQVAGGKAVNDLMTGGQTVTGRFTPEQNADGSYSFPWE